MFALAQEYVQTDPQTRLTFARKKQIQIYSFGPLGKESYDVQVLAYASQPCLFLVESADVIELLCKLGLADRIVRYSGTYTDNTFPTIIIQHMTYRAREIATCSTRTIEYTGNSIIDRLNKIKI